MSKIEWTQKTWNPVVGCSIVSPGCTNCYAMRMAARLELMSAKLGHYHGLTKKVKGKAVWTGKLALASDKTLMEPMRRKTPTTYFVNSMSDLFHDDMPSEWIKIVWETMRRAHRANGHIFQVLTKRPQNIRRMLGPNGIDWYAVEGPVPCPEPGIWLGTSVERQQEADERREELRNTPAEVYFVSYEPALGPVNWKGWEFANWLISGGESGPGARPSHPDWHRAARDFCRANGIAYFFKQWGAHAPASIVLPGDHLAEDADTMLKTSKKAAGRLLDGREWNEMPRSGTLREIAA